MIRYAKGYRPTKNGMVKGTGLLAANSFPTGAEVYINDRLTTATDNTLNLDPGEYNITIKKDGFFSWSKKLTVEKELVTQTNATLYPSSPTLEPVTYTGAVNVIPAPDGNHIAYTVASASATAKNGLYVHDLNTTPISINRSARQIARTTSEYDYSSAVYTWSPNSTQILVSFEGGANILLDADRFNDLADLVDVTVRLPQIFREWEEELARSERAKLVKLPDFMIKIATESATNLYLSPDGEKLLYQALVDVTVPSGLLPSLPSSSTQTESRDLKKDSWYVYDLKEDKNFLISQGVAPSPSPSAKASAKPNVKTPQTAVKPVLSKLLLLEDIKSPLPAELLAGSPSAFKKLQTGLTTSDTIRHFNAQYSPIHVTQVQWLPDSYHLLLTTDQGLDITEYDATNRTTIYGGPFDKSFVYPWPDGSKLITRIQFSPETIPNLYTIKLK